MVQGHSQTEQIQSSVAQLKGKLTEVKQMNLMNPDVNVDSVQSQLKI